MMNILVPTDFTPASLQLVEQAVKTLNRKVNVVLFHAFDMPSYTQDLVRRPAPYTRLMNDNLRQSCKQLKEEYPRLIGSISFGFMTGSTQPLFRNFLEANEIEMIVLPQNYRYVQVHPDGVNPISLFKKSKVQLLHNLATKEASVVRRSLVQELTLSATS